MSTQTDPAEHTTGTKRDEKVTIHIDKQRYKVDEERITAEALRAIPQPPVGPDRDLYLETQGPGDDVLIEPGSTIVLEEGMRFFTAPSTITPGHAG